MHPTTQQRPHLLYILPHTLRPHAHQFSRIATRRYNPLRPHPPHLVVRQERALDHVGGGHLAEQGGEHERVFDGLAGALALVRGCGVRGVAHYADAGFGVGRGGGVVPHGPEGGVGGGEEELGGKCQCCWW